MRVARTAGIGAVVELANQFHRPLKSMEMAIPMVTHIHPAPTDRTRTVQDVEFPLSEIRILGPSVRHRANLRVGGRSIKGANKTTAYTKNTSPSSPLAGRCQKMPPRPRKDGRSS